MNDTPRMATVPFLLSILLRLASAQSSASLSLTFAPASLDDCAAPGNLSSASVSFTTFSIPEFETCINLNETFTSLNSNGFTAAEGNASYPSSGNRPIGVNWTISGGSNFSPSTNYSHIFYQQVNITSNGNSQAGEAAERYVIIYPGYGCEEVSDYTARPYYGYSCQSTTEGQCNQAAYSVASFEIVTASRVNNGKKCVDFAKEGGATRLSIAVGALPMVVAAVAWFLML